MFHVKIDKDAFVEAFSTANRAVDFRTVEDAENQEAVLIETADGSLKFFGGNSQWQISVSVKATEIVQEGFVSVGNPRNVEALVKKMPPGELTLQVSDNQLVVKHGRRTGLFPVFETKPVYSQLQAIRQERQIVVKAKDLLRILDSSSYAASRDALHQMFLRTLLLVASSSRGTLTAVSTDSNRLAVATIQGDFGEQSLLLPIEFADNLARNLSASKNEDADVTLSSDGNLLQATWGNTTISGRLVDATFPNWENVVPKTTGERSMTLPPKVLIDALERVSSVGTHGVSTCSLTFDGDIVTVGMATSDANSYSEVLDSEQEHLTVQGNGEVGVYNYNTRYLLDALKKAKGDTVRLSFYPGDSPLLLEWTSEEDSGLGLVMPVRVR